MTLESKTVLVPSALSTLIAQSSTGSDSSDPIPALTIQVLHNLQHQHLWTSLSFHNIIRDTATNDSSSSASSTSPSTSTTPLISGIPPRRIYTHPDEQAYMLETGLREEDLAPERMFVLPTAQGQSWSLRKLAAVFDSLPDLNDYTLPQNIALSTGVTANPTSKEQECYEAEDAIEGDKSKAGKLAAYYERRRKANSTYEWGGKRLLLAMVDKGMGGDGTVVYYVIQDGVVKPRQN